MFKKKSGIKKTKYTSRQKRTLELLTQEAHTILKSFVDTANEDINKKIKVVNVVDEEVIKKNIPNYNTQNYARYIFSTRFNDILHERNIVQKNFASTINENESTISNYRNGVSEPSLTVLNKIATALDVPVDYLLGNIDVATYVPETIEINKQLGLSERSIEVLTKYNKYLYGNTVIPTINCLIEEEIVEFLDAYESLSNLHNPTGTLAENLQETMLSFTYALKQKDHNTILNLIESYFSLKKTDEVLRYSPDGSVMYQDECINIPDSINDFLLDNKYGILDSCNEGPEERRILTKKLSPPLFDSFSDKIPIKTVDQTYVVKNAMLNDIRQALIDIKDRIDKEQ